MHFVNPFKALRPTTEHAFQVAIPSIDYLTEDITRDQVKNNPWSYLNVFNAENSSKAKQQFELMKKKSILSKDKQSYFYLYRISNKNSTQIGVVGTAKLSSYHDFNIRGHEDIFLKLAETRLKQMDNLNAQIGPIYGVCPDSEDLTNLMNKEIVKSPIYSFDALDQCKHEMWIIEEEDKINEIGNLFDSIKRIYIADGHHRMEALLKLSETKKQQNKNHTGNEPYNFFMVAVFPKSQVTIGSTSSAPQIENVISVADKRQTMPPKSTWFDPKPLDGLVAFDFNELD